MSILSLKNQISAFFEQQLDSTRQRLDSNCLIENLTASRLTEPLDSLDSLDSNLEGSGGKQKPCNIGNIVQKKSKPEQLSIVNNSLTLLAANDKEVKPYSHHELIHLLNKAAKPLYHHLIDCQQCSLEDARYCSDGMTLGNTFDCLLLCFDDATNKRYELMNQVIKARVSGRRLFESLSE